MMKNIVQKEDPVLRQIAEKIDFKTQDKKALEKIIIEMQKALHNTSDGVAIAAPQIGASFRIFVVAGKVFDILKGVDTDSKTYKAGQDEVYINPTIKKLSKEKDTMEEGCLSVRNIYGKIIRSKKATVEAYDINGKKFTRGGSGLLAQIFQHETDHLNGTLFIDNAFDLVELDLKQKTKQ